MNGADECASPLDVVSRRMTRILRAKRPTRKRCWNSESRIAEHECVSARRRPGHLPSVGDWRPSRDGLIRVSHTRRATMATLVILSITSHYEHLTCSAPGDAARTRQRLDLDPRMLRVMSVALVMGNMHMFTVTHSRTAYPLIEQLIRQKCNARERSNKHKHPRDKDEIVHNATRYFARHFICC